MISEGWIENEQRKWKAPVPYHERREPREYGRANVGERLDIRGPNPRVDAGGLGLAVRRPPPRMETDEDEDGTSDKVRRNVLGINRRTKAEPRRKGDDPGKGSDTWKGYALGKGKAGSRGRGAVSDQGACSFQSRAPVKPTLTLKENETWADASESSLAVRREPEARLTLRERDASGSGTGHQEQADRAQPHEADQSRDQGTDPAHFHVDIEAGQE